MKLRQLRQLASAFHPAAALAPGAAVPATGAGGSLLVAAVLARPLPVPVINPHSPDEARILTTLGAIVG